MTRATLALLLAGLVCASPARAQGPTTHAVAIDTTAAVDQAVTEGGVQSRTGFIFDAVVSAGLGRGFEVTARPYLQRLPSGEWNRQIWIAELRYERRGRYGVRAEAGLIPSPIGLANLTLRPAQNPTIAQPASLFTPLPTLEAGAPRTTLMGAVYPYGASVTVSGTRWDARAAILDSSPLRTRRVFGRVNPPRLPTVVYGAGVTPLVGLRVGASVAQGGWRVAGETPAVTADQHATIVTAEAEYSVGFTKVSGEWVRDRLDTRGGHTVATGWFIQGQQTITPRWFAAGRVERMAAPAYLPSTGATARQRLQGVEAIAGYRATPDVTVRAGYRTRRAFGQPAFLNQFTVSLVWFQRWI